MKRIITLVLILIAYQAEATTRYISPTGSGATCSSAVPCSFATGYAATTAGDELVWKNGTYTGSSTNLYSITHGGSAGNYVTFRAENPCVRAATGAMTCYAILDGEGVRNYGFSIYNNSATTGYIKIQGFEIKGMDDAAVISNPQTAATATSFIEITNNYIHDIARDTVACADDSQTGRMAIFGSKYTNDWIITGNLAHDIGRLPGGCTTGNADYAHDHFVYVGIGTSASIRSYNWLIQNNIWYEGTTTQGGFFVALGNYAENIDIINNTVVGTNRYANMEGIIFLNDDMNGLNIQNNIFYGTYNGPLVNNTYLDTCTGCSVYNNLTNASSIWGYTGTGTPTFTGEATNLTSKNPYFTNIAANNYTLTATSPAINAAYATNAPSTDYFGYARPVGGLYDIGAVEYPGTSGCSSDTTPPTTPSALTVAAASSTGMTVSWTASTDACSVVRYNIERCLGAACSNFSVVTETTTSVSVVDSGLSPSTVYRYRVVAFDASSNYSTYSTVVNGTTDAAPAAANYKVDNPSDVLAIATQDCSDFVAAGAEVEGFTLSPSGPVVASLYLLADDIAMYYCFTATDTDIRATLSDDGALENEDSIEIAFDTNSTGTVPTYKFIFSPANAVADYNEGSVTWDATRIRHVAYVDGTLNDATADTGWVVKGTLVWGDWGVTKPVTGTTWSFDARWNRKTIDTLGSVDLYNSDGGSFETVAGFGILEFTDIDRHIKLTTP